MLHRFILFILFAAPPLAMLGQYRVGGIVQEAVSGEPLYGATVLAAISGQGAVTDASGYFNVRIGQGGRADTIEVAYVGYVGQRIAIAAGRDTFLAVSLVPGTSLSEVVVLGRKDDGPARLSKIEVRAQQIKDLPGFLGEADVLKSLVIYPGVSEGKEGTSGLHVRGGGADQNLIMLDGIPVYNPTHLGGFISVFDVNVVQGVTLYKGGFPAQYGGRLSSTIDVRMKEGSRSGWNREVAANIFGSKISMDGPLLGGGTTLVLSARRSFLDLLYRGAIWLSGSQDAVGYSLHDLSLKLTHRIGERDKLSLTLYGSGDRVSIDFAGATDGGTFDDKLRVGWSNRVAALAWTRLGKRYASTHTVSFSGFRYGATAEAVTKSSGSGDVTLERSTFSSRVGDLSYRFLTSRSLGAGWRLQAGCQAASYRFDPQSNSFRGTLAGAALDTALGGVIVRNWEVSPFGEAVWAPGARWHLSAGIHAATFWAEGQGGARFHPQPRLLVGYDYGKKQGLTASYGRMVQFLHLLSNSGAGLPTDLWVPATGRAPAEYADHFSVGWQGRIRGIEWSLEGFYKLLGNLIEFREGASFFSGSGNWEDRIATSGTGRGRGVEAMVRKVFAGGHEITVAYTLAKYDRRFDKLNGGRLFPYRYDRRHEGTVAYIHRFAQGRQLSVAWFYHTGDAVSLAQQRLGVLALGRFYQEGRGFVTGEALQEGHLYGGRNSFRTPAYHRLDLNMSFVKAKKRGERVVAIGVYNAYNRINPYYLYFKSEIGSDIRTLMQLGLFPALPYLSYSRKW